MLIVELTFLLLVANGTPVIARQLLGRHFALQLDAGSTFLDGEALFGHSKTLRGVIVSIIVTSVCAGVLGFDWYIGVLIGGLAMLGDLLASFIKRRLKKPVSSQALGLDQIPESLLPMLACKNLLSLSNTDIAYIVGMFFVLELLLSRLLFHLKIRTRPY